MILGREYYFICTSENRIGIGGRQQFSRVLISAFSTIVDSSLMVLELPVPSVGEVLKRLFGLMKYPSNLSKTLSSSQTPAHKISLIFNGSDYGVYYREIKMQIPNVEIITIFHNCETGFFFDQFKSRPSFRNIGITAKVLILEYLSLRYSSKSLFISGRDRESCSKILRDRAFQRNSYLINLAMPNPGLDETLQSECVDANLEPLPSSFFLLLGSDFFANIDGISWFLKNVAVHWVGDEIFVIVGRGMEHYRELFESCSHNVKVIGTVPSTSRWLRNSTALISPLMSGRGINTRVVEAMSHGVGVIGTPKSFEGVHFPADSGMSVVCDSHDFLGAMERYSSGRGGVDPARLMNYFRSYHSPLSLQLRLAEIL